MQFRLLKLIFSYLCSVLFGNEEDDITRRRLLTLVFGGFEPRKFKLINQELCRSGCRAVKCITSR